ncbi:MAG: hypothetical protein N3E52_05450 [Candidatus Bathyarchaeota archaeon]|nr:hypothetical protein [Candidatus Bathyarchaeota archaeon]
MNLPIIISEKAMRLVPTVILGAESPINIREDSFAFEVYCAEYTAAYYRSLLMKERKEKWGLSAFSTFLIKKYGERRIQ